MIGNKALLSFKKVNSREEIEIDFKTATTNIAIFGGTGTGKTTGVCYPAIYNLIENDCSGLVLDVKGDYTKLARQINRQQEGRIFLLGVKHDCARFNLIAGIEPEKLKSFLEYGVSSIRGDLSKYWGSNAIEDTVLAYEVLAEHGINPTLSDLYHMTTKHTDLYVLVKDCSEELKDKIERRVASDGFSIFKKGEDTESRREQRTWQFSALNTVLRPFYEDPLLNYHFCNNDFSLSIADIIYKERKSIVLEVPFSKYAVSSLFILKLVKAGFIDTIKQQDISDLKRKGYGSDTFTFMLIDEYQQFLTDKADLSMDDNNWFDISRGYGHINIISSQSVDSLDAKANEKHTNQLIGNCMSIIHLATHAERSLANIATLVGSAERAAMAVDALTGQNEDIGFIYINKSQQTRTGARVLVHTGQSQHSFMNSFIHSFVDAEEDTGETILLEAERPIVELLNKLKEAEKKQDLEGYVQKHNDWEWNENPIYTIKKNLVIITTKSYSEGFNDFNCVSNDLDLDFSSIRVDSAIFHNEMSIPYLTSILTNKDTIFVIIRGGGDLNEFFLNKKPSLDVFKAMRNEIKENNSCVAVAVGHTSDRFDDFFEIMPEAFEAKTPTDLAYKIKKMVLLAVKGKATELLSKRDISYNAKVAAY